MGNPLQRALGGRAQPPGYGRRVSDKLLDDVRTWLQKGGYVLEMRVARLVRQHTNILWQGAHYTDPVTGKDRETDVGALMILDDPDEDRWHAVRLIIECKQTSAPWVFFVGDGSGNGPASAWDWFDEHCETCLAIEEDHTTFERAIPTAYAVTEKHATKAPDHAYEAVQQVASTFLASLGPERRLDGHPDDVNQISGVAIPFVVTTSPLVLCKLDEAQLEEVDAVGVTVARADLRDDGDGVHVTVVRETALAELLDQISDFGSGDYDDEEDA